MSTMTADEAKAMADDPLNASIARAMGWELLTVDGHTDWHRGEEYHLGTAPPDYIHHRALWWEMWDKLVEV